MNADMNQPELFEFEGASFLTSRPHRFGLVIHNMVDGDPALSNDYLHHVLLSATRRDPFFELIQRERLVVCKNVQSESLSYRKVRGKSSMGRLSQAEYYHHDGCSCPEKPLVNEIRLPFQSIGRNVATAIAPFKDVVSAQLRALPGSLLRDDKIQEYREAFLDEATCPPPETWDQIQGYVTRLVRRDMDAESARDYFRKVDQLSGAFDLPWEMGESRLMLNNHSDLTRTVQHRRAFQKPKVANEQNGSLVKRWTAEELP